LGLAHDLPLHIGAKSKSEWSGGEGLPKLPPSPPLLLAGNRHIVQSPGLFFLRTRVAADW
jgi:hypothetical protein